MAAAGATRKAVKLPEMADPATLPGDSCRRPEMQEPEKRHSVAHKLLKPLIGSREMQPVNVDKKNGAKRLISCKVFIFAACVTPHTIIKETFR